MSYLNLIEIDFGTARASVADASAPVSATKPPRLIWAELNFSGFVGRFGTALALFTSLAWMFVYR